MISFLNPQLSVDGYERVGLEQNDSNIEMYPIRDETISHILKRENLLRTIIQGDIVGYTGNRKT